MVVSLLDPRRNKRYARLLQTSVAAFGVILVVWSVTDRRFRDGEGALGGGFALLLALSMASVLAGWGLIRKQRSFAFWLALGLTGQAAALQLIEAGKQLRYQHYKSMGGLLEESHPLLLALLALQFLLVTLGIIKRWPQIRDWVARNFRAWQLVGIGLVFVFTSATVSRQASVYASELLLASAVQAVNLGNIVLAVWALPEGTLVSLKRKLDSLLGASAPESEKSSAEIDRFVLLAAAWVVG
ncbi:MAG: hypothetical protein GTO43_03445, partial [Armatimonadetes bacterium]|nr:hypothetical protein [Armatimonadota bacterium]